MVNKIYMTAIEIGTKWYCLHNYYANRPMARDLFTAFRCFPYNYSNEQEDNEHTPNSYRYKIQLFGVKVKCLNGVIMNQKYSKNFKKKLQIF